MAAAAEVGPMMAKVALECGGDISASQEDILANSSFLGAGNAPSASASASQAREDDNQEEEVFATPPEVPQQDPITMCSLPFTPSPSQPHSPSPPPSDDDAAKPRRKPRVCTRKVRGAKVSTPAPAPAPTPTPSPKQQQQPEQPPRAVVDPLYRAMLMIPTAATAAAATTKQDPLEEFLALARQRGIF